MRLTGRSQLSTVFAGMLILGLVHASPLRAQGPSIVLSSPSATFRTIMGVNPQPQTVTITNGGGGLLLGLTARVAYTGGYNSGWLSATLSGTAAPITLTLAPNTASVPPGNFVAVVTLSCLRATPVTLTVNLTVIRNPKDYIGVYAISPAPVVRCPSITLPGLNYVTLESVTISTATLDLVEGSLQGKVGIVPVRVSVPFTVRASTTGSTGSGGWDPLAQTFNFGGAFSVTDAPFSVSGVSGTMSWNGSIPTRGAFVSQKSVSAHVDTNISFRIRTSLLSLSGTCTPLSTDLTGTKP